MRERPANPLRLHRSGRREQGANHNEGFLEGAGHVSDQLRADGFHQAADAMMGRLFAKSPSAPPSGEDRQPVGGP